MPNSETARNEKMKAIESQIKRQFKNLLEQSGGEIFAIDDTQIQELKTNEAILQIRHTKYWILLGFLGIVNLSIFITILSYCFKSLFEEMGRSQNFATAIVLLIVLIFVVSFSGKKRKAANKYVNALSEIKQLNYIDGNPEFCKDIIEWSDAHVEIKEFIELLAAKKRLPTIGEHSALKNWVDSKRTNEDVELLKQKMNVSGGV